MGADSLDRVHRAAEYAGVSLSENQTAQLVRFHAWLENEAVPAGGIGPHERDRLWSRHIADSLVFGVGLGGATSCLDIGTGVGLPGIPLAIAFPETEFVLLDRSGRRCDLVRRAAAILRLDNCAVLQAEIGLIDERFDSIVSRAAMPLDRLMIHVKRLLSEGGVAILGLSHAKELGSAAPMTGNEGVSVLPVPPEILDSAAMLLRIEATQSRGDGL